MEGPTVPSFAPPRSTYQRALDAQPKACPVQDCTSQFVAPLFEGDIWDCDLGHQFPWTIKLEVQS